MREFKFRYWDTFDKEEPKMIYFDFGMVSGGKVYPNMEKTMQYTGLKDKNGKEIYEGDLLKGEEIWEVIYAQTLARFMMRDTQKEEYNMSSVALKDFEVIGNIYEVKETR